MGTRRKKAGNAELKPEISITNDALLSRLIANKMNSFIANDCDQAGQRWFTSEQLLPTQDSWQMQNPRLNAWKLRGIKITVRVSSPTFFCNFPWNLSRSRPGFHFFAPRLRISQLTQMLTGPAAASFSVAPTESYHQRFSSRNNGIKRLAATISPGRDIKAVICQITTPGRLANTVFTCDRCIQRYIRSLFASRRESSDARKNGVVYELFLSIFIQNS